VLKFYVGSSGICSGVIHDLSVLFTTECTLVLYTVLKNVKFEVFMVVKIQVKVFWGMMPCSVMVSYSSILSTGLYIILCCYKL
jgi:hypothetical protein